MSKCLLNNTPLLVRLNAHYVFVKVNARLSFLPRAFTLRSDITEIFLSFFFFHLDKLDFFDIIT